MNLGDNMMLLRKKKKISQATLGELIGTSGDVVGRYERGDITPSIDVVAKIADALEVSIDFLIGRTSLKLDQEAIKRLEGISSLSEQNRDFIFKMVDMALQNFKTKQAFNS